MMCFISFHGLLAVGTLLAASPPEEAAPSPSVIPKAELRWPTSGDRSRWLKETEGWDTSSPKKIAAETVRRMEKRSEVLSTAESFFLLGKKSVALGILDTFIQNAPDAPVSVEGASKPVNLQLRDLTLAYALRYQINSQPADARKAEDLLLQFSKQMPHWPLCTRSRGNTWRPQADESHYTNYGSGGLWGRWYHLDLQESFPLLRAYDRVRHTLTSDNRTAIENDLFDFQVRLINRWERLYHNTDVYEIDGLLRFGFVLERPEYIHQAVKHLRALYFIGFSPDGFWSEAAPAYHRQVASRLSITFPNLLAGYTDPPGWRHPKTGERFDNLRLDVEFASHLERMKRSQEKLTLPNGAIAAANDTDPDRYNTGRNEESVSELLGTTGFAVLGSGKGQEQQQIILNFEGTHGHEHYDINGLQWHAFDTPVFDETRYRSLPNSGSSRAWSMSTYAHNTVVIDERNQPGRNAQPHRDFSPSDAMHGMETWPLRGSSGGSNHMGDLLLFDGRNTDVQAVEVEGKKGYGDLAQMYRRSILKVDLGKGAGYLVDIFRVKGGKIHDYMLHGPLALPYTASFSLPLKKASGELAPKDANAYYVGDQKSARFIQIHEAAQGDTPWHVTFVAENGVKTRTWMLSPEGALIQSGMAPAINRMGDAPFVAVREEGGESVFVAVHEVYRDTPKVRKATLLHSSGKVDDGVALEIELEGGRKEIVTSTSSASGEVTATVEGHDPVKLRGRLGWLRIDEDHTINARLWDGTLLSFGSQVRLESSAPAVEGTVVQTLRRDAGDPVDAIVISGLQLPEMELSDAVVHVDLGGELTWSYRIKQVTPGPEGCTLIHLEHEPGFEIQPDGIVKALFHPGWGIRGKATARIPLITKNRYLPDQGKTSHSKDPTPLPVSGQ